MSNPSAITALFIVLEKAVTTALRYDPGTQAQLAKLAGQTLLIDCSRPAQKMYIQFGAADITLAGHYEDDVSATLSGSGADIAKLLFGDQHSLYGSGVSISGNAGVLAQLQGLAGQLDIDWEMALADLIGTLPAHTLANSLRTASGWGRERAQGAERLVREYLAEESSAVLGRSEFALFVDDIDNTRLALDRLGARIARLRARQDHKDH
ncbi:ubiquinone biosynthesis accessory factor UbiJ [Gilvimarinus polysaccharolyticus]|uniref:ubiquinone biosynthesis accessory factor UbiJ n=1 Tax=Gilvimarinus polysaccharolyticus TaxID=863921 RepID=UPI0006739D5D|nr:SCP2 sterol-binding domain-containing protein [Gilvimarinus polysaccharolyticus]